MSLKKVANNMNRKGEESIRKLIYYMFVFGILFMIIIGCWMLLENYKKEMVKVPSELNADLIISRFINTPECFAYQDNLSGKVSPNVLDLNKFTSEQLNKCYLTDPVSGTGTFNFQLKLDSHNVTLHTNNFFKKIDFTRYRDVIVKKGDKYFTDRLTIYVVAKI